MFKLTIDTDNEHFDVLTPGAPVGHLLIEVAHQLCAGVTEGAIRDDNGNPVGSFRLTDTSRQES